MAAQRLTGPQQALIAAYAEAKQQPKTSYQRMSAQAKREHWETTFAKQIASKRCLPPLIPQFAWHPRRMFRSDWGSPELHLLIEVDGGLHSAKGQGGAHNSAWGYERDRIRDAEAILQGYTVLRVTPAMIERGEAIEYLVKIVAARYVEAQQRVS